jgi:hypothetical protein
MSEGVTKRRIKKQDAVSLFIFLFDRVTTTMVTTTMVTT